MSATLILTYSELRKLWSLNTNHYGIANTALGIRVAKILDAAQTDAQRKTKSYSVRFQTRQSAGSWRLAIDTFKPYSKYA